MARLHRPSLPYHPFLVPRFNSDNVSHQARHFSGNPDDAIALFDRMLRTLPLPSVFAFNKLLTSVVKKERYFVALYLFDEMLQRDVPENLCTLNIAIDCYSRLKRPELGFSILGSVLKRGYEPDVVTFNTLIKGLLLVGKNLEAANLLKRLFTESLCRLTDESSSLNIISRLCEPDMLRLLKRGWRKARVYDYYAVIVDAMASMGVSPDTLAYNSIMKGLCEMSRWNEVENMLKKMVANKVYPDLNTYNMLVDAHCKEGRVEAAEHVMKNMNVEPDIVTYNSFIHGYCLNGRMNEAGSIVEIALKSGIKPSIVTYNTLMNGHCKKGGVGEVFRLFMEIQAQGLERDLVSYNIMLDALCKSRRITEALSVFNMMEVEGVVPDIVTYSVLIGGLCRAHCFAKAFSVLNKIEDKGIDFDTVIYNTLIKGLCSAHCFVEAFSVLRKIEDKGLDPDIFTYNILINGLCKDGKVKQAKDLFGVLPSPDVITYNILIGALCKEGEMEEAKVFMKKMVNNNCLPDRITCNVLVRGLLKNNMIHDAIHLLEEMDSRGFTIDATTLSMMESRGIKSVRQSVKRESRYQDEK
ncbi:pentatricopeptide repeat-containing protein At5g16640, mitochondrial-like [Salvia splendens]|uniref:pentatricopeptide repeat-containing protein At5g16640, mitochondrial-like n=1 Tax=Salvia splendens TaxID=180675 RepID=UPI001104C1A4|nr:pentatricopeptide repeat-containing protein At5g16640, mitochondrial-like [Salvia splendens]XP_042007634.1 pentatricopeptide repeat-containing protein At5g16640, mitochondrial-like [Salvia splendens]